MHKHQIMMKMPVCYYYYIDGDIILFQASKQKCKACL